MNGEALEILEAERDMCILKHKHNSMVVECIEL